MGSHWIPLSSPTIFDRPFLSTIVRQADRLFMERGRCHADPVRSAVGHRQDRHARRPPAGHRCRCTGRARPTAWSTGWHRPWSPRSSCRPRWSRRRMGPGSTAGLNRRTAMRPSVQPGMTSSMPIPSNRLTGCHRGLRQPSAPTASTCTRRDSPAWMRPNVSDHESSITVFDNRRRSINLIAGRLETTEPFFPSPIAEPRSAPPTLGGRRRLNAAATQSLSACM